MFDLLKKGWDVVFGSATVDPGDSSLIGSDGFITRAFDTATDFLGSKAGQTTAQFASQALFGKSGMPEFGTPKGKRLSAPRGSSGSQMAKAGSVDMGITPRVKNAANVAAQNAQAGSPIRGTFDKLASRPSKGPLLRLDSPAIRVSPRARA